MNTRRTHITPYSLQVFLMGFWLYVALDKLWDLEAFHRALLRQPFPDGWADMLYWSLPLVELGIALLLVLLRPQNRIISSGKMRTDRNKSRFTLFTWSLRLPYLLSASLLCLFSIYIALGIAGLYAQRPCGCASVFSSLSWPEHLLANILLLTISILGWCLTGPTTPMDTGANSPLSRHRYATVLIRLLRTLRRINTLSFKRLFPRRFAPFPG